MAATLLPAGLDPAEDGGAAKSEDPSSPQAKLLGVLATHVGRTPAVFQEAMKNRDMHQKQLTALLEETLRQIQKSRAHMRQRSKNVLDTTKAYTAKFEHMLSASCTALNGELVTVFDELEASVGALEAQMGEVEEALQRQHDFRVSHIEANLGPIRDEAKRLSSEFDSEKRTRRLQEEEREKILADEVEALARLMDSEDFEREQQLMAFERWATAEHHRLSRKQSQVDKDSRRTIQAIRADHAAACKERQDGQNAIIDSITSFVTRYREHLARDLDMQAKGFRELAASVGADVTSDRGQLSPSPG